MGRLRDGYQTLIEFSLDATVQIWEVEVKPPGFDGGGPINDTTMQNVNVRTQHPKSLYGLTNMETMVAYDTAVIDEIITMINQIQKITLTFADGSQEEFYGWIDKFEPETLKEGEEPRANIVIEPSNQTAGYVETIPNQIAPAP